MRNQTIRASLSPWPYLGSPDEAADVQPVTGLAYRVEREQGHKARDLQQEVDEQSHAGVEGKRSHRRHVREAAKEEAARLRQAGQQH